MELLAFLGVQAMLARQELLLEVLVEVAEQQHMEEEEQEQVAANQRLAELRLLEPEVDYRFHRPIRVRFVKCLLGRCMRISQLAGHHSAGWFLVPGLRTAAAVAVLHTVAEMQMHSVKQITNMISTANLIGIRLMKALD